MPSPFPGMNPYLEQDEVWHDFHERFVPLAADVIGAQAGSEYIVKIDERIYVHDLVAEGREFVGRADVAVARRFEAPVSAAAGAAVASAPAIVELPAMDVESQSLIEIRDRRSRQLITVVELLSPSNKQPGADRQQYLAKRGQVLASSAHLVEIDLLRGGPRMPMEELPPCDYCVLVSRSEDRPKAGVWPIRLRDPLPRIPVPLRAGDADLQLDLGQLLHRIYDAARYQNYMYEGVPWPPLSTVDAGWAEGLIATLQSN
jgi:hypothetical protein